MTNDRSDRREAGTSIAATVDFDRLDRIRAQLGDDGRFRSVEWRLAYASDRLVLVYSYGFYPLSVSEARLEPAWFENGDFSIHYHETHAAGEFDHRWDRHPSEHNARDHVHPGPAAPSVGEDAAHPQDWREVLTKVLTAVEARQRGFWSDPP